MAEGHMCEGYLNFEDCCKLKIQEQHYEKDYLSKILYGQHWPKVKVCRNTSWRCLDCNLETTLKITCQEKSQWYSYNCQTPR